MTTLDANAPLDDLEPLGDLIDGARVVGLGESAHHVEEYYRVRHRILRFLVERCDFTVIALEAPFAEATALNTWIDGGPGEVADVARTGIAMTLGDCAAMHDQLLWLRDHNRSARNLRCVGVDLPGSLGSPLASLLAARPELLRVDPGAVPIVDQAVAIIEDFHDPAGLKVLAAYPTLSASSRDTLSALLGALLARSERLGHAGVTGPVDDAIHHVRAAWYVDQLHRESATGDFETASTYRDLFMAQTLLRLLRCGRRRIAFVAHNWHIKKTADTQGETVLLPAGHHLARRLGTDYRAIGLTAVSGSTAVSHMDFDLPQGFAFRDAPLPAATADSVEAALPVDSPWGLTNVGLARGEVTDAGRFRRMRMADYFLDENPFDGYDLLAHVPRSRSTDTAGDSAI